MIDEIIRIILSLSQQLLAFLQQLFSSFFPNRNNNFYYSRNKTIDFDTGISATIEHQIAEGGFSYIYSAHDANSPRIRYALKRIICPDEETLSECRAEAKVHRMVDHHVNTMKLLGMKIESNPNGGTEDRVCYMLFPLITGGSLRDEVTKRKLLQDDAWVESQQQRNLSATDSRYFTTVDILNIFAGLLKGVKAMHDAGYCHCDIKLENVMLDKSSIPSSYNDEEMGSGNARNDNRNGTPILMDFGSARKLVVKLTDRRTVLQLTEEASKNSTVSYRAPELFDGGCRHGPSEPDVDGKVDVWSCGCVLYGLMYGTSPFEMEFRKDGTIRIVECTHLRVLSGKIPYPPKFRDSLYGYKKELNDLVEFILVADREDRPDLDTVIKRVEDLLLSCKRNISTFDGISRGTIV